MPEANTTVECFYCKKPVNVYEAFTQMMEHLDGNVGVAVFHRPPETCALDWATQQLNSIANRMAEALKNFKEAEVQARAQGNSSGSL